MPNVETMTEGAKVYRNEAGQLHRSNGPAVIREDGYLAYWQNGYRHRSTGPAIVRPNGDRFWYYRGLLVAVSESLKENVSSYERKIIIVPKHIEDNYRFSTIVQPEFDF